MKLRLMGREDWGTSTVLQRLQERVSQGYEVFPVDSYRAFEELVEGEGENEVVHHVIFQTFVMAMRGEATVDNVETVCDNLWTVITQTFPSGSMVMWRRRPEMEYDEITGTRVRLRLGIVR